MRRENFQRIEVPQKLLLEFGDLTVGELSNILRQYQALLRAAWQDTCRGQNIPEVPNVRLLTTSATTSHSFELVTDFAIPMLYFSTAILGPVKEWPHTARATFQYITAAWSRLARNSKARGSGQVFIQGGKTPQLKAPVTALQEEAVARRIETLWSIAQSGRISLTLELPDGDERATYRPEGIDEQIDKHLQ